MRAAGSKKAARGPTPLPDLLIIMVCSVLTGAKSLVEMAEWAADTARDPLATLGIVSPHTTTLARIHLLAKIDHTTGSGLVQQNVSEKHNEITYFQPLLEGIKDLASTVVSADALHTQREHAEYLHFRDAHYILTVKASQTKLHDQLCVLPWHLFR